jgi:hypothetical protein
MLAVELVSRQVIYWKDLNYNVMGQEVETPYIRLELLENGILIATYKRRTLVTLEMAKEIVQTRLDFTGREPRPVMVINQGVIQIDKSARKYVSSNDGVAGIKAAAIIVNHLSTSIIMTFILTIERPEIPARMFTRQGKAMAWLERYL